MTRATMPTLIQKPADWGTHTGQVLSVQVPPDPTLYTGAWNNAAVSVQADNGTRTYLLDNPNPGKIIALLKLAKSGQTLDFFTLSSGNYIAALVY